MPYIEMPKLSDTMTEGTVVKWRVGVGDQVSVGDVIAEVETDKAVMELEAFDEGKLGEIYVAEGGKARIGEKLALLLAPGETVPPPGGGQPAERPTTSPSAATQPPTPSPQSKPATVQTAAPVQAENPPKASSRTEPLNRSRQREEAESLANPLSPPRPLGGYEGPVQGERVKASPLARRIASAKGVNLGTLRGSGPGGRIVARDVESACAPPVAAPATVINAAPAGANDRRIPLSGMRKIIADRLLASKTQIPHFYLNIEVDAGELLKFRAQANEFLEKSGAGKLTINDLVLKAVIAAAVKVPRVNAAYAGDAIIEYADVHLAVAVAVEDGLVTPVIRQAQNKSLRAISEAVKDLATRARTKRLKPEEYQGGTLTVSNLGSYGIESFSAVINPPQAMILAIGAIVKKPVVNTKDEIVVAHRMAIGLSADHRVVDGAVGAQYLAELRHLLENPVWMLL